MDESDCDRVICRGCDKEVDEYGYCEVDGSPFGYCCWGNHVDSCDSCKEQLEC